MTRRLLLGCGLGLSVLALGPASGGPAGLDPDPAGESMPSCDFEIQARNTDTHNIYLDLYTSRVKNYAAYIPTYKQLKMQNARVGPRRTLTPQRVTVGGRCNAGRRWKVYWRPSANSSTRTKHVNTDRSTRTSSSSGRRVLNLGDVGRW